MPHFCCMRVDKTCVYVEQQLGTQKGSHCELLIGEETGSDMNEWHLCTHEQSIIPVAITSRRNYWVYRLKLSKYYAVDSSEHLLTGRKFCFHPIQRELGATSECHNFFRSERWGFRCGVVGERSRRTTLCPITCRGRETQKAILSETFVIELSCQILVACMFKLVFKILLVWNSVD